MLSICYSFAAANLGSLLKFLQLFFEITKFLMVAFSYSLPYEQREAAAGRQVKIIEQWHSWFLPESSVNYTVKFWQLIQISSLKLWIDCRLVPSLTSFVNLHFKFF